MLARVRKERRLLRKALGRSSPVESQEQRLGYLRCWNGLDESCGLYRLGWPNDGGVIPNPLDAAYVEYRLFRGLFVCLIGDLSG